MNLGERYRRDGYVSNVPIVGSADVARHCVALEHAEERLGPLHYLDRIETLLRSAFELATHPSVLDAVEACIGPHILLHNATFIIKEPGSSANVAWHQDLTYWGLSDDDAQVSMWLALAPATEAAGCMSMLPGSHLQGRREHATNSGGGNLLLKGQHITGLDVSGAVPCALAPGEASFHHGWTVHASGPNISTHRRIGLNAQFLAPHNRFDHGAGPAPSAMLVRGEDRFGYYVRAEPPATGADLDPAAIAAWRERAAAMKHGFQAT